jgi:hypothetical protein
MLIQYGKSLLLTALVSLECRVFIDCAKGICAVVNQLRVVLIDVIVNDVCLAYRSLCWVSSIMPFLNCNCRPILQLWLSRPSIWWKCTYNLAALDWIWVASCRIQPDMIKLWYWYPALEMAWFRLSHCRLVLCYGLLCFLSLSSGLLSHSVLTWITCYFFRFFLLPFPW